MNEHFLLSLFGPKISKISYIYFQIGLFKNIIPTRYLLL